MTESTTAAAVGASERRGARHPEGAARSGELGQEPMQGAYLASLGVVAASAALSSIDQPIERAHIDAIDATSRGGPSMGRIQSAADDQREGTLGHPAQSDRIIGSTLACAQAGCSPIQLADPTPPSLTVEWPLESGPILPSALARRWPEQVESRHRHLRLPRWPAIGDHHHVGRFFSSHAGSRHSSWPGVHRSSSGERVPSTDVDLSSASHLDTHRSLHSPDASSPGERAGLMHLHAGAAELADERPFDEGIIDDGHLEEHRVWPEPALRLSTEELPSGGGGWCGVLLGVVGFFTGRLDFFSVPAADTAACGRAGALGISSVPSPVDDRNRVESTGVRARPAAAFTSASYTSRGRFLNSMRCIISTMFLSRMRTQ